MNTKCGVIMLDENEIIISIYTIDEKHHANLIRHDSYDFAIEEPGLVITTDDIVQIIAKTSFSKHGAHVNEWKLISRNLPEKITINVEKATGLTAEHLTLNREQELMCKGTLLELQ